MKYDKFTFFFGGPFSNWKRCSFIDDLGDEYNCVEQYMMAEKARIFGDDDTRLDILNSLNPREQKELGRKVVGFNAVYWSELSRNVVYKGCYYKFTQNPTMKAELLSTKDTTLVEASAADTVWGIGLDEHNPDALNRNKWKGTNWLGQVLTQLRNDLLNNTVNLDSKQQLINYFTSYPSISK